MAAWSPNRLIPEDAERSLLVRKVKSNTQVFLNQWLRLWLRL